MFPVLNSWVENAAVLLQLAGPTFTWPFTQNQLDNHIANSPDREFYVGIIDNKAVAFGEIIPQETTVPRLGRLIVDNTKRGQGIGKQFITALSDRCVERFKCPTIQLYVLADNETAIQCYLHYGFRFMEGHDFIQVYPGGDFLVRKMECSTQKL